VDDPPEFVAVPAVRGDKANPLAYDKAALAQVQREAYPEVRTLELQRPPAQAFSDALAVLEQAGLQIVDQDPAGGRIEATATTFWFGFKDDMVVRIRALPGGGSQVDARSVSRVGQSDLGANARRIGEFLKALEAA
jgi:uncharacterized protein (DUF1499 family)